MIPTDLNELYISPKESILSALKQMDSIGFKLLIVGTLVKYENLVSIGDIQRGIISGIDVDETLNNLTISQKEVSTTTESDAVIKEKLRVMKAPYIPIIADDGRVETIKFWEEYSSPASKQSENKLNGIKVIIMAGGKGTRLRPITNIIPKPLVPIGEKPIMEHIIDRFRHFGASEFHLSVNYKGDMIRNYFAELQDNYTMQYYTEDKPLGTAGSLSLIKDQLNDTFFISNCDILIDDDYENMLEYHRDNNNAITIVGCLKSYSIPYGIMTTKEDGQLEGMVEKPTNTYLINTGMYILEPEVLQHVPADTFFHITELIDLLKKEGKNVGVFPVSEGSWQDIGEWPEYLKTFDQ